MFSNKEATDNILARQYKYIKAAKHPAGQSHAYKQQTKIFSSEIRKSMFPDVLFPVIQSSPEQQR